MFDCVAWREVFIFFWETDFFEGFAAGGGEGVFVQCVGFAAWEGDLPGVVAEGAAR